MPYPYYPPLQNRPMTIQIKDISTPGQKYFVPGFAGSIRRIWSVINGAIADADVVLTTKINGAVVTGGSITIAYSGSAAGDVDSAVPTGALGFTDGDAIEIETNGASTNAVAALITFEVAPS